MVCVCFVFMCILRNLIVLIVFMSKLLINLQIEYFLADARKPPVAHGDLSSSNVLVGADGACVLCDFGCATILHSSLGYHRESDTAGLRVSRDVTLQNKGCC